MRKFLTVVLCLSMVFSIAGAHPNHNHAETEEPKEENELAKLTGDYPSSAVFLGALELALGIILIVASYIHYSRRKSS